MPRPSAASCTSAPAKRRRFRPAQATLEQHGDNRPVDGAPVGCCRFRFHAAPGAPGQAGRCEDGRYVVGGERIGLAPAPARRLSVDALQNAAHAIMAGRIVGAGVDVAGADRGADRAHGGRGGALRGSVGEVGGDCQRIGGQGGVAVQRRPFRPPAAIAECRIDPRPVGCAQFDRQGNGERGLWMDGR